MKKVLLSSLIVFSANFTFAQCNPVSSIDENFDTWDSIDECWTGINNGGMFLVGEEVTFYTFNGADTSMYLISPEIEAGNYNLTFDFSTVVLMGGEATPGITVEVGTLTTNANADSFVPISESVGTTLDVQSFAAPVSISNDAKYFAIKIHADEPHSAAMVDNLLLTPSLGVKDLDAVKVSAYPNPVVDQLTITSKENIQEVKLFNANGQLVLNTKANSNSTSVNVSSLKSGVYVAQVTTSKGTQTVKVIKK